MSDEQERKTWWSRGKKVYRGDAVIGSCYGDDDDGTEAAQHIVAQLNRITQLEQRAERAEAAIADLVEAVDMSLDSLGHDHIHFTHFTMMLSTRNKLRYASEQARRIAALPKEEAQQEHD